MANKKISTTELDFDNIKNNLKSFLQGQSEFEDYDFEGSSLSVLLDILAYNTHYNALYKNLAVNESFLDSASKRSSVVSRAKEIGYIPRSANAPTATVDVIVSNTTLTPPTLNLPAYSQFTTIMNGNTYSFYTLEQMVTLYNSTLQTYTFSNVNIKQGRPLQYRYNVSEGQRYIIPNTNVDMSTIRVKVLESQTSTNFVTFNNNENIVSATGNDPIYFMKEIDGENYELEFGNGVIGKALQTGNIVVIDYIVTDAALTNSAKTFSYQGSSLLGGIVSTITKTPAQGGMDIEDIESIRFNAPRAYTAQNRAVTVDDYKSIIKSNYANIDSISVWGGENNNPPVYGKVFIAVKPKTGSFLTTTEKDYIIRQILKNRNVVSITPELVDPAYIDIELEVSAYYNSKLTTRSADDLKALIRNTILNYNTTSLNRFDGIFRYSNLSSAIDLTENSIVSNIMTVKLNYEIDIKYGIVADYKINLANPIYYSGVPENSIVTNGFYIAGNSNIMYLEDLPMSEELSTGVFRLFYYSGSNKVYVRSLGSINYKTGELDILGLNITGIVDEALTITVKPQSNDVVSVRNQLVQIPSSKINVNVILDQVSMGNSPGNTNYIFTSSRN